MRDSNTLRSFLISRRFQVKLKWDISERSWGVLAIRCLSHLDPIEPHAKKVWEHLDLCILLPKILSLNHRKVVWIGKENSDIQIFVTNMSSLRLMKIVLTLSW